MSEVKTVNVKLFRIIVRIRFHFLHMTTCVTFVVYVQLAPNSDVSAAFWVTLKHDMTRAVMTTHEY